MKLILHLKEGKKIEENLGNVVEQVDKGKVFEILGKCIETNGPIEVINPENGAIAFSGEFNDLKSIEIVF